jgi:hypothetical protein
LVTLLAVAPVAASPKPKAATASAPAQAKPASETPPECPSPQWVAGWTVGAVGVGTLIAAMGTGIAAVLDANHADELCDATTCPDAEALEINDRAAVLATATNGLLIAGLGVVAVGGVLLLFSPEQQGPKPRGEGVALVIAPQSLTLVGAF